MGLPREKLVLRKFSIQKCEITGVIEHPGLIEQLKAEKFDAAFSETFDFFGPGTLRAAFWWSKYFFSGLPSGWH